MGDIILITFLTKFFVSKKLFTHFFLSFYGAKEA